ncbi:MAG: glycosyltransferase family 4 protein [Qipengyuania sp.]
MAEVETREGGKLPQVAVLFTHYAPYHVDRVEAAARRLEGRARVLAVETADSSREYAWEPASGFRHAQHVTLFPDRIYEEIGQLERLQAYARHMRHCDLVLSGVPWSAPDIVALSWRWRARGRRIYAMTDSKFDDKPRNLLREQVKARLLAGFSGAVVAGLRQRDYLRFLGFGERPILPGYDTLSVARIRRLAEGAERLAWEERPFTFVGRFVGKKNLPTLLEGYARYRAQAGEGARRMLLVGDGPQAGELRALTDRLGIAGGVEFTGRLTSQGVARRLSHALALCLFSVEEQWGLVVNEAVALGIPAIVSPAVGARDALVRGGETGHVVEPQSPASIARAMLATAGDRARWQALAAATLEREWLADAERFADAVELLIDPQAEEARSNVERFWELCESG